MTEDMIEAQQEALMSEKAENRVLMQSTMLVSDMSAFKAANPGAVFEDFLRWHSPTDFSTETGLSARMTLPGKQLKSKMTVSQLKVITGSISGQQQKQNQFRDKNECSTTPL